MGLLDILIYILFFLPNFLLYVYLKKPKSRTQEGLKLPPGSMGWPYIGETLQLYSQDPNVFFASKQKRHGEIFKTHILGCPCIMLTSPEAAHFILVTKAHLFRPTYPKSKETLIGPSALFFHQGDYHRHLRELVESSLSQKAIRTIVPNIEVIAVSALESWAGGHTVTTFQEMKKFAFDVGIMAIFRHLDSHYKDELEKNYFIVNKGYNSLPYKVPGTAYSNSILARKKLSIILREIICDRKEKRLEYKDLLGSMMSSKDEKCGILTDDQIVDNIIGVLFAAQDTTASALTWVLKFLGDNLELLDFVKAEQMAIYESNKEGKQPLTWSQTRNMPFTCKVIQESLRISTIISFTYREAIADVEYKGYLIPKGWKVMPLFRNMHHNPEFFSDPYKFDPSRFEAPLRPNTFMPFGNGVHSCPGHELAKLEILILVHHLVTKFRWKVVGTQIGIEYGPFPVPKHGLPAKFQKISTTKDGNMVAQDGRCHSPLL